MSIWTDRLAEWLAKNRTCTLGSVVNLPMLFPDWAIADVEIRMLSAEMMLQVMMVMFKGYGPPMSFSVYKSLRADYTAISRYALALSHVVPPDIVPPARTEASIKQEVAAADDGCYSKVVLLRNIALPSFLGCWTVVRSCISMARTFVLSSVLF